MHNKLIITVIAAILSASSFNLYSGEYPDSLDLDFTDRININHNVNGKMIGGNPQTGVNYGAWSSWETSSHMTNCTEWTPHTDTVDWGKPMIQTNLCDAEETRHREVTYYYADGSSNTITEYETVVTKVDDEQDAVGTRNYIQNTTVQYTSWTNTGSTYSCSSWSPSPSTVNEGVRFNQSRNCKQDQSREATYYDHWANGDKTVNRKETETKTVNVTEHRTNTGTKKITGNWYKQGSNTVRVNYDHYTHCTKHNKSEPTGSCTIGSSTTSAKAMVWGVNSPTACDVTTTTWSCK